MQLQTSVADGVARVVLDAPPLNILTQALLAELRKVLADLSTEATLRVLVLSATGKHFSAGASVEEHLPEQAASMIPEFMDTIEAVRAFPLPVIAAVHGRCLGGAFELAMAADVVLAADDSLLGVPEIQLGVFPPAACLQLGRWAPPGLAAELIFCGSAVRAGVLEAAGLVRRVVPGEQLAAEAAALAAKMAAHSSAALRVAKRALLVGRGCATSAERDITRLYLDDLMATHDAVEGLRAFLDKRRPDWSHS